MTPPDSRRDAVRQFKRALIRDAAKTIFAEHGIDAVSVRQIASAAGYTTGAIYTYFESKNELYAEVLRESLSRLGAQVAESVETARVEGRWQGPAALRELWEFYQENPADFALGFYLYDSGPRPASLSKSLDVELNDMLDATVRQVADGLVADGLSTASTAHQTAVLHATWIFGLLLMTATGRIRSLREAPEPLLETYLTMISARPGTMDPADPADPQAPPG